MVDDDDKVLFLGEWRAKRGLSLADVAARTGVKKQAVWKWETEGAPTIVSLVKLARAYDVDPAALFSHPDGTKSHRVMASLAGVSPAVLTYAGGNLSNLPEGEVALWQAHRAHRAFLDEMAAATTTLPAVKLEQIREYARLLMAAQLSEKLSEK